MKLGDHISYEKDGEVVTERVESVRYESGSPAIYRQLNWWQRVLRKLTPPRWRKPLLVRAAELPKVTINQPESDPVGKTLAQVQKIKAAMDELA
jgi:hypothetical protein